VKQAIQPADLLQDRLQGRTATPASSTASLTAYFLTAISFPATNRLCRCLAATEIQKFNDGGD
jgi:hypothetical protein